MKAIALLVAGLVGVGSAAAAQNAAAPKGVRAERGFRALVVRGPLPFDAVGILAGISSALAAAGIPLLAISTFDTDYVLVREERLVDATQALRVEGHGVSW